MTEIKIREVQHDMCENCGEARGRFQICHADGRIHHHGCVHTVDEGLKWLCDYCCIQDKEARAKIRGENIAIRKAQANAQA